MCLGVDAERTVLAAGEDNGHGALLLKEGKITLGFGVSKAGAIKLVIGGSLGSVRAHEIAVHLARA
jgi:hypothetical protein